MKLRAITLFSLRPAFLIAVGIAALVILRTREFLESLFGLKRISH